MSNEYVIQWKSMVNGRAGRGSKFFTRDEADQLVSELNEEYPDILHEVIPAPPLALPATADETVEEEALQQAA